MLLLFINIFGIFTSLATAKWIKNVNAGKVSRNKISLGFISPVPAILLITYLGWKTNYFKTDISIIFFLTFAILFLMTAIEASSSSSDYSLEESKIWMKWIIVLLVITYLIVLCIEYPKTKKQLEILIIPVVTFVISRYIIQDK